MRLLWIFPSLFLGSILTVALVQAGEPVDCPKSLAIIETDKLSADASQIMIDLYKTLGCSVELKALPGRRGIKHFNEHRVDGELFRIEKAEASYHRKYIRSSVSLMTLSNTLWLYPDKEIQEKYPIGYVLGIVWQEHSIKKYQGLAFHDEEKMFEAYRRGRLGGFLSSDLTVNTWLMSNHFSPAPNPVASEVLMVVPLYHYLSAEFRPFMEKLSELLATQNPFRRLQVPAR